MFLMCCNHLKEVKGEEGGGDRKEATEKERRQEGEN